MGPQRKLLIKNKSSPFKCRLLLNIAVNCAANVKANNRRTAGLQFKCDYLAFNNLLFAQWRREQEFERRASFVLVQGAGGIERKHKLRSGMHREQKHQC